MKHLRIPVMIAALSMALVGVSSAGDAWFDVENCGMCKNMAAEEGLMDHMKWETHTIADGMLSVMTVDPEYMEAWQRAHANMEMAGQKMMGGEMMELCGFCTSYGGLMMAGAKGEMVETMVGHVSLLTSTDEEVVAKIHKHAKRTIAEYEKWMAEESKSD